MGHIIVGVLIVPAPGSWREKTDDDEGVDDDASIVANDDDDDDRWMEIIPDANLVSYALEGRGGGRRSIHGAD
jgi:hypothetical protein